ncbi:unnamed protein product [Ceratitis capitata]|uniref:(Mediterranean fruit fly) hypothetical protein n=1 Tax=Ceratitis capitata TaxID=7213 RepID=W8BXZ8_CERCA|nr:unnamed protein product [Ceratitis capitata]
MLIELNLQNLTQIFWTIIFVLNLYVLLLLYRISKVYRSERRIKLLETANIREHIEFMRSRPENSISSHFSATGSFTTRSRFFEQFLDTEPPQLRSCMPIRPDFRSKSSTTAADEEPDERATEQHLRLQRQQQQQKQHTRQLQRELQQKYNKSQNQQQQNQQSMNRQEVNLLRQQPQPLEEPRNADLTYNTKTDDEHTLYISDSFGRVVHEIPFRECDYMDALQVVLGDQRWQIKRAWNDGAN